VGKLKNAKIFHLVVILIFVLAVSCALKAQETEGKWVESKGEVVIWGKTPEQAQQLALEQAQREAVAQVNPVEIHGGDLLEDMVLVGEFVNVFYFGEIVEDSIIEWEVEKTQKSKNVFPDLLCRLHYRAKVTSRRELDPTFRMGATLNNHIFSDGDDIVIEIQSTSDCYITVLNRTYDNKISLLIPSRLKSDNFLKAKEKMVIPSETDQYQWRFTAQAVPRLPSVKEAIIVIATKKKIDFLLDVDENTSLYSFPEVTFTEFQSWLSVIPMNERSQEILVYKVFAKKGE
jgi:hypothetical protein